MELAKQGPIDYSFTTDRSLLYCTCGRHQSTLFRRPLVLLTSDSFLLASSWRGVLMAYAIFSEVCKFELSNSQILFYKFTYKIYGFKFASNFSEAYIQILVGYVKW